MLERDPAYWAALGAEISTQLRAVTEKKPAHEILGVSPQASAGEVNKVFDAWAWKLHPDQLGDAPHDLITAASRLLTVLKEARDLMLDSKRRKEHAVATAVQSVAERAREAEVEYIKGKRALGANNLEEAEDCLRRAVSMEPQNGLYLAELVWVQFLRTPEPQRVRQLPTLILEMQHAAARSPKSARIAYLVGMLFKAQDNLSAAEQAFEAAQSLDPRLLDAARELRLLKRRSQTGTYYPQAPRTAPVQERPRRAVLGRIWPPWVRKPDPK